MKARMKKPIAVLIGILLLGSFAISTLTTQAEIYDTGLQGWWRMDTNDNNNGKTIDRSPDATNNQGTLVNIATSTFYSWGKLGQGFQFDGVDDTVDVGKAANISLTGAMTVGGWAYFNATSSTAGNQGIITKGAGSSNRGWELSWQGGAGANDLQPYFQIATSSTEQQFIQSTVEVPKGRWGFIVGVYEPSSRIEVWVNNVKTSYTATAVAAAQRNSSVVVSLGDRPTGCSSCRLNGNLDDIRIYNRALSDAEISQWYNLGIASHSAVGAF